MPPQQLLLSWKDHNGALVSVFENLLKRNTLVDCTLAADGQYLKAHKMVLSACSSYFELLFSQESEKNPIVILKDVKFQELEAAVNFMYRGEVEICEDRLAAFLEVADSLRIKGLGSERKTQDSKTAVLPRAHSRKEVTLTQIENTGESFITLDSDNDSNDSSTDHPPLHREIPGSFSIPSTLASASSYSLASASTSCPVRAETNRDRDKVAYNQCSSPSVSTFRSGDTVPSDVNTVIKSEPVTDTYLEERSDETERDFDDVTMMEDQEDWDDPNAEYTGDDNASNQHDPGFSVTHMKTEESTTEHTAGASPIEHISSGGFSVTHMKTEESTTEHTAGASPIEHISSGGPGAGPRGGGGGGAGVGWASLAAWSPWKRGGVAGSGACQPGAGAEAGGAKLHRCDECAYATAQSGDLKKHRRVHTGERPFECGECGAAFAQSNALRRHARTHTGERPFRCGLCGAAFSRGSCLRDHQLVHSGHRYLCPQCSKTFASRDSLRYHLRTSHRRSPLPLAPCP